MVSWELPQWFDKRATSKMDFCGHISAENAGQSFSDLVLLILGPLGGSREHLGTILDPLWTILGPLGVILRTFGTVLGPLGAIFGPLVAVLGPLGAVSWGHVGTR